MLLHSARAQHAHNGKDAGEKETDDTYCADLGTEPRRSPRKCRATRRFSPELIYVDKTDTATAERKIERQAVTTELRTIGLKPDMQRTLLQWVHSCTGSQQAFGFIPS